MSIDFQKAAGLLHIAEKALQFGQRMRFLHDAALKEIDAMNPEKEEGPKQMPPIERQMRGETAAEDLKRRSIPEGAKFGGNDE